MQTHELSLFSPFSRTKKMFGYMMSARHPRGMRGSRVPFAINASGNFAIDPVSLERIPMARAVRVGPHVFNSRVLREILKRNTRNPLTRQPFPRNVIERYGIGRPLDSMNWVVSAPTLTRTHANLATPMNWSRNWSRTRANLATPMNWEPTRITNQRRRRNPASPRKPGSPRKSTHQRRNWLRVRR